MIIGNNLVDYFRVNRLVLYEFKKKRIVVFIV